MIRAHAVVAVFVLVAIVTHAASATTTRFAAAAYSYDRVAPNAQNTRTGVPRADGRRLVAERVGDPQSAGFLAAEELPDATIIVRGGESELPPAGEVFSGSQGQTLDEAAAGVRHGTVRSTTAGEIRAGGGTVRPNPEFDERVGRVNHQHVDVCLGAGSCPFSDPFENPVPKSGRFGFPYYPYDRWGP